METKPTIGMRAPCASTVSIKLLLRRAGRYSAACRRDSANVGAAPNCGRASSSGWNRKEPRTRRCQHAASAEVFQLSLDIDIAAVVGDQRALADDRGLHGHRLHVAHGQLTSNRGARSRARCGSRQHLIEVGRNNATVSRSRGPAVVARNNDWRDHALGGLEATNAQARRMSRATAEALVETVI